MGDTGTYPRLRHAALRRDADDQAEQRNANRFHGELYVVVRPAAGVERRRPAGAGSKPAIAREAGARFTFSKVRTPIEAIVDFARSHGITQIFIGHSQRESWTSRWFGDPVDHLIRCAKGIDIQVFPHLDAGNEEGEG